MTAAVCKEKLGRIRKPEKRNAKTGILVTAAVFAFGAALGVFSKWLDELALDPAVWWHGVVERLDLGNFFSEPAVWLLLALLIAVFSASAGWAAARVFVFFTGMCAAYHLYTVFFSGFDPASYMRIWYGITLVSPLPAAVCWYARGEGAVPAVLNAGIFAVFWLACFSIGFVYVGFRGILYLLVFLGAAAALYRKPKRTLIALFAGLLLSVFLSPLWPYR